MRPNETTEMERPFVDEHQLDSARQHENETLCQSLKNKALWKLTVYGMVMAFAFQFPDIVIAEVGAKYFNDDTSTSDSCTSGNAKYAYYSGIFASVGGVIAFLFEGYMGRLSDVYGRKKVMYFTWFCMFSTYFTLSFSDNVWFSIGLSPLLVLCGALGGSPSVLQASLADSVKCKKNRTVVFALLFGLGGLVVIIAAVLAPIVVSTFGLKSPFYVFTVIMLLNLLWLIFVVEETLPPHKRVQEKLKYENPFRIFVEIKNNKLLAWFSAVVLVTAIPEAGMNDIMTNYCNEQLGLCDDAGTTTKDAMFTGTLGAVMLVSQLGLMPLMARCLSDTGLLMVGLLTLQSMMFLAALLYFMPNIVVALGIWASYGGAFLLSPIVDGSLSKRLKDEDQGVGIGVIHSMKGVTICFAPYMFGGLYKLFDKDQWYVITPFIVGSVIALCGFLIALGPLRRTIEKYDEEKLRCGKVPVAGVDDTPIPINE